MARDILGVLLAAGTGSRLRPLTDKLPKCLLEVGGRPLLDYQIEALAAHGVEDLLIVTGHAAGEITRRYPRLRAIHDPEYAVTNNLHSLWAARREFAGRDFVCLHTDLLFHPAILGPCLASAADVGVVLDRALVEETMKARVEAERVLEISKSIPRAKMFGTFLGIARFSVRAAAALPGVLDSLVAREENRQAYFTACLPALASRDFPATYTLTEDLPWVEIDSPADFERASRDVLPLLPSSSKKTRTEE
jgi:choline kinase